MPREHLPHGFPAHCSSRKAALSESRYQRQHGAGMGLITAQTYSSSFQKAKLTLSSVWVSDTPAMPSSPHL